ncbi:unnamed protein product [Brassica rapa subsp. trilocularis]
MRVEGEEEFQEEDVWSVLREGETSSLEIKQSKSHFPSPSYSTFVASSPWTHSQKQEGQRGKTVSCIY